MDIVFVVNEKTIGYVQSATYVPNVGDTVLRPESDDAYVVKRKIFRLKYKDGLERRMSCDVFLVKQDTQGVEGVN